MLKIRRFLARYKTGAVLSALLSLSLLFVVLSSSGWLTRPAQVGMTVFSVFQNGFSAVAGWISGTVNSIGELRRLRELYNEAEARLAEQETLERNYQELRRENELLREQLGFRSQIQIENVAARVIGKDPENVFNTIVINRGSMQGIENGMPVVAYHDGLQGLVGKVVTVALSTCTVLPVYDGSFFAAARLQESRYEGLVNGAGTENRPLVMSYINRRAMPEIQVGDIVVTSGMSSIFPVGIAVGRVSSIVSQEYQTTLDLMVEPIVDFDRLEYVVILKTHGDDDA